MEHDTIVTQQFFPREQFENQYNIKLRVQSVWVKEIF